jgi:hypothetical protein
LLAGIGCGYLVRLTFPSVEEPLATSDRTKREPLLTVLNRLRLNGECLLPHHSIAARVIKSHERFGASAWESQDIRFQECERALARREFSNTESDQQREFAYQAENTFTDAFANARPRFEELFASGVERPATADELVAHLDGKDGAFWVFAASLYERVAGRRPTGEEVRAFIADCPPFLALMLGLAHAQFEWSIKGTQTSKRKRVGRLDLFSSIYLPYCDIYITDDDEQRRCLREIATTAEIPVEIVSLATFAARLMPLTRLGAYVAA